MARSNEEGKHSEAGHGTHLCHTQTAVFEVVSLNEYTAARKPSVCQEDHLSNISLHSSNAAHSGFH